MLVKKVPSNLPEFQKRKMKSFTLAIFLLLGNFAHGGIFDSFPLIGQIENRIEKAIGSLAQKTMAELNSGALGNFSRTLAEVEQCFEPKIGNVTLNFFDENMKVMEIVKAYYAEYREKSMSAGGVNSLMASVRSIIDRCLRQPNSTAKFGLTFFSDFSEEEFQRQMMGAPQPAASGDQGSGRVARSSRDDEQCSLDVGARFPEEFDWRSTGKVSSVKNQKQCGSCYAFAAIGALESANLIHLNMTPDLSEQRLVDCVDKDSKFNGGCKGAYSYDAFSFLQSRGTTSESVEPYTASEGACKPDDSVSQRISDFCIRGAIWYGKGSSVETLDDSTMKQALVQKGPLYTLINGNLLHNYRSGVLDEQECSDQTNHAVLMVGYTLPDYSIKNYNGAYIFKNSWGPNWGEDGFFRVTAMKKMCGINKEISWPIL